MKILIIQTAFIGDVILATAFVEEVRHIFPKAELHFLLRKGNESLLLGNPNLSKVMVWDKKLPRWKSIPKLISEIRAEGYTRVYNLQRFFTSGLLTACSGAPEKIGFDKNPLAFFYTKRVSHEISVLGKLHEIDRNRQLLEVEFKGKTKRATPVLFPNNADFESTTRNIPYVTLSPASVWFTKQMPAAKAVEIIEQIPPEVDILLLGGKGDALYCKDLIQSSKRKSGVEILAGQLSFLQSAALMKNALANFVNDSAPLHIASAMHAPTVAIFCSTVPAFGFGPLSHKSLVWQTTQNLSCRPCGLHGKKKCPEGHFKCGAIDVSQASKLHELF